MTQSSYSREQRAKRTCLHVHLATAARVKYPDACIGVFDCCAHIFICENKRKWYHWIQMIRSQSVVNNIETGIRMTQSNEPSVFYSVKLKYDFKEKYHE